MDVRDYDADAFELQQIVKLLCETITVSDYRATPIPKSTGLSSEEVAQIVFEKWPRAGQNMQADIAWNDLPQVSPDDYASCIAIGNEVIARLSAASQSQPVRA